MRVFLLVIDSFGIGEMPDADKFGDLGSNTYKNIYLQTKIDLINLKKLGLNNIEGISDCANGTSKSNPEPVNNPQAAYGRLKEKTFAKDTTAGHYEITGILMDKPYQIYKTFPAEIVSLIESKAGIRFIGNEIASGTEIIQRLGNEHLKTGFPILYTSQDSVMQIAADTSVVSLEKLYRICEIARNIMVDDKAVGRIIARPFIHKNGKFIRTEDRKDYALPPPADTLLDKLHENKIPTIAVGKIFDIFCGRGILKSYHTGNNKEGVEKTIQLTKEIKNGFVFINLVDTDMLYGHRNDVLGYANALKYIDDNIPNIINNIKDDDVFIITADHGCDPTTPSTDHSREYVPLLIYGKNIKIVNLKTLDGFDNISDFICCLFGLKKKSLITELINNG